MKTAINWIFGLLSLLLGLGVGGWVAYNYLVEMQPEAKGKNPAPALILTAVCLYVGVTRIRQAVRRSREPGSS